MPDIKVKGENNLFWWISSSSIIQYKWALLSLTIIFKVSKVTVVPKKQDWFLSVMHLINN